jgi:hypothetical protein
MKKSCILILSIFVLLISGCAKENPFPEKPEEKDFFPDIVEVLLISLDISDSQSGIGQKYEIYNTGRYFLRPIDGMKGVDKEAILSQSDLDYLKSLVNTREFKTIPNYMDGNKENCPTFVIRIESEGRVVRAESCAITPDPFNKLVYSIEKLR